MTGSTIDAQLRAFKAAGFVTVGTGRGHVRFAWPGTKGDPAEGTLLVPTDRSAPEYQELALAVLAQLEAAVAHGEAASRVLEVDW